MNPSRAPETWHAPDFERFLVKDWEDEFFLFNPLTAHTHVLNPLGMAMLSGLAERPQDLEQIHTRLFGEDAPMDDQLASSLREQLAQFVVIGLAVRAS